MSDISNTDSTGSREAAKELHELAMTTCTPWKPETEIRGDERAELLLANGADPNMGYGDDPKHTALHTAAYYGRIPLTRLLLRAGANPSIKNKSGETALDIALKPWDGSLYR